MAPLQVISMGLCVPILVGLRLMEWSPPFEVFHRCLQVLHSWLELIWPLLFLPPLFKGVSVRDRLGRLWDQVLDHRFGYLWSIPAVLLPALLPFARDWDQAAPTGTKRFTVVGLFLAIGLIQIYGQLRNQRYKELADAEISRIGAGINQQGTELNQQGTELKRLTTEFKRLTTYLIEEKEEGESSES